MAAYIIANVEVTDPVGFQEYVSQAPPIVAKYGGKYLVRGGQVEQGEGDWDIHRVVIIQFDTMEQLKKWYHSDEYSEPMKLRIRSTNTRSIMVEGI